MRDIAIAVPHSNLPLASGQAVGGFEPGNTTAAEPVGWSQVTCCALDIAEGTGR
ncbi:MAG: hypothetical protein MIN69_25195 [Methylorubrum extorquens]|uniref:hypothetical protein n=1 Tax=Methylorubrum extorquens TaxID=408 RepID=UPI002FEE2314